MCLSFDGLVLNWDFVLGIWDFSFLFMFWSYVRIFSFCKFCLLKAEICNISSIFEIGSFAFVIQKIGLLVI